MQHEDNLINHRSSWNATVQAFLFAAFAVAVQSRIDARTEFTRQLTFYAGAKLIPLVGLFVAVATLVSVVAAARAISQLDESYEPQRPNGLPRLTGGGDRLAHLWGFFLPFLVPLVLAAAWFVTLACYGWGQQWSRDDGPQQPPPSTITLPATPGPASGAADAEGSPVTAASASPMPRP